MQDDPSPESLIRNTFELLRAAVERLLQRWSHRVDGRLLWQRFAAIEEAMSMPLAPREDSHGFVATVELVRFIEERRRRWVAGPTLPVLRAGRNVLAGWAGWIDGAALGRASDDLGHLPPGFTIEMVAEDEIPALLAAMESGHGGAPGECAVCAALARRRGN